MKEVMVFHSLIFFFLLASDFKIVLRDIHLTLMPKWNCTVHKFPEIRYINL